MYQFELTLGETQLVLNGLAELPAKQSLTLILKLQSLAQAQDLARRMPPAPVGPPPAPDAPAPAAPDAPDG